MAIGLRRLRVTRRAALARSMVAQARSRRWATAWQKPHCYLFANTTRIFEAGARLEVARRMMATLIRRPAGVDSDRNLPHELVLGWSRTVPSSTCGHPMGRE